MVNYCNHIVENQIWRVSCCSVAPVSLLGVLMKLQPLCCNQGAVGGNTARLPLNLFALFNHNQHIYFPALVAAAKRIITTNVSRLCNPVDLVNLRSRRPVILTDIFGSRITKSNPKAQNQIKAKDKCVLLIESSVSEIKSPVSPSQRDRPSLFLDNQSAGRISTDQNPHPLYSVDTLFKHNGATSVRSVIDGCVQGSLLSDTTERSLQISCFLWRVTFNQRASAVFLFCFVSRQWTQSDTARFYVWSVHCWSGLGSEVDTGQRAIWDLCHLSGHNAPRLPTYIQLFKSVSAGWSKGQPINMTSDLLLHRAFIYSQYVKGCDIWWEDTLSEAPPASGSKVKNVWKTKCVNEWERTKK